MNFHSTIAQAGAFPVYQVPVRHYPQTVDLSQPRCAVLHTVEGSWDSGLSILKRHYSPHFMLGYNDHSKKAEIVQFVPIGFIGASLKKHNDQAIVQIEMVGFSEEKPWVPGSTTKNPHPETLEALCSLMNVCEYEWGIPLSHPWPDSNWGRAGLHTPHRGSGKFGKVAGWYGHQDVPENLHWDCGYLEWSKVFAHCHELETTNVVA